MYKLLTILVFVLYSQYLYADTVFIEKLYEKGHYKLALAEYEDYTTKARLIDAFQSNIIDSPDKFDYSTAIAMLSRNYFVGEGVQKNIDRGLCLLYESALYGNDAAINGLIHVYSTDDFGRKDQKKAALFKSVVASK